MNLTISYVTFGRLMNQL